MRHFLTCFGFIFVFYFVGFSSLFAATKCHVVLSGSDQMKFDLKEITANKKCTTFTLILNHTGKLPKTAMGHNVLLSLTKDVSSLTKASMKAGPKADYIPKDKRVIAYTKLIGGGGITKVVLEMKNFKKGEDYTFFCSFPGHFALMKGKFIVI